MLPLKAFRGSTDCLDPIQGNPFDLEVLYKILPVLNSGFDKNGMGFNDEGPFVIEPHAVFVETGIQDWQNLVENLQVKRIPLDWVQAVSASPEGLQGKH